VPDFVEPVSAFLAAEPSLAVYRALEFAVAKIAFPPFPSQEKLTPIQSVPFPLDFVAAFFAAVFLVFMASAGQRFPANWTCSAHFFVFLFRGFKCRWRKAWMSSLSSNGVLTQDAEGELNFP